MMTADSQLARLCIICTSGPLVVESWIYHSSEQVNRVHTGTSVFSSSNTLGEKKGLAKQRGVGILLWSFVWKR